MKTDSRDWTLDLSGGWDLRDDRGDHALEISFPDDIISALHRAERIPDPYWGRNEYGLRWIAERDWIARRSFDLPTGDVRLRLSGLDTVAEVRVNGSVVLEAANAFRRFDVDLSGVAQPGSNMIEIRFASNVAEAARKQEAQPFFVPYHAENCPIPNGNMLRKPQCDFGWDWNIALAPCGLYGAIEIVPNGVTRLRDMS
ncbi:MAG: glycoside hydrolase family 2 protein, partial [Pseudomonadota bacterium]